MPPRERWTGPADQRLRMTVPRGRHPSSLALLRSLSPYFRQVTGLLVLGSVCGLVMNTAIVLPALLLGRAVNVVLAMEHHHASADQVGLAALLFVGGTAATELPRIGKRYWLGVARTRFRAALRQDALRGVLAWPPSRFAAMPVGEVMARIIGDVDVVGVGVGEIMVETWDTLLFSVSLLAAMFWIAPNLAMLSVAPVPVSLWLARRSQPVVARRTTVARQRDADLTSSLREQLRAMRLLRVLGRTEAAVAQASLLAHRQSAAELAAILLDEGLGAAYMVLLSSGVVFIIWLGGAEVAAGSLSLGALVALIALFSRFVARAPRIPQMVNRVQAAAAAHQRLAPLLADPLAPLGEPRWATLRPSHVPRLVASAPMPWRPPEGPASLRLTNVSLTYPGALTPALEDLTLEIPAGALVAVTGPIGSGKTTLAKVAAGLLVPDSGRVELDQRPMIELEAASRSAGVGYMGQSAYLFSGTVADNVVLWAERAPDGSWDAALERSLAVAGLERDLARMPLGADTQIGESGTRVSGGQRQRITLARALAAGGGPLRLLVLDEPFSAVDMETEVEILAGLRRSFGAPARPQDRLTILLCSHRLAGFPLADKVAVLEAGRIREVGTHQSLLQAGQLYARIFHAQHRVRGRR